MLVGYLKEFIYDMADDADVVMESKLKGSQCLVAQVLKASKALIKDDDGRLHDRLILSNNINVKEVKQ